MCNFYVFFEDNKTLEVEHVCKVTYNSIQKSTVTVEGPSLTSHCYPLKYPLWLQTDNGITCISGENIRFIQVHEE